MPIILSSVGVVRVRFIRSTNNLALATLGLKATPTISRLTVPGQHGFIDLVPVASQIDPDTGVAFFDLVATDDPDVNETFGWTITGDGWTGFSRTVQVPQTGMIVETITVQGASRPAVWLNQLADFTGPSGSTGGEVATRVYVDDALDAHEAANDPHPQYALDTDVAAVRQVPSGGTTGQVVTKASVGYVWADSTGGGSGSTPDATTSTKGKAVLLGGTADAPTVPWSAVTGKPTIPAAYSDEQAQDAVGAALTGQTGKVSATYDDGNNRYLLDVQNLTKSDVGLNNVNNTADANKPVSSAQQAALDLKVNTASLATVATTGSYSDLSGTVPASALPALAINDTFTVADQAAMLALTAQRGDIAIRQDRITAGQPAVYILGAEGASTLANWINLPVPADAVASVAGKTGTVTLAKGDVGLGNVDNTSDATKPVSTDQAAAIATRIARALIDAKGDLIVGTADDTPSRVGVGTDGQVLTANSSAAAGVAWQTPASGGGGTTPNRALVLAMIGA